MSSPPDPLVHDWNGAPPASPPSAVELLDETLRDGLQSPSARHPSLAEKIELLVRMDELGLDVAKIGMPAVSARVFEDAVDMARAISQRGLRIRAACAARAVPEDVARVAEVAQRSGTPVEAYVFIPSSPIRAAAEGWGADVAPRLCAAALEVARSAGLSTAFVAEDATRASPSVLSELFRLALDHGATRCCLCDTAGHATPDGVARLLTFARGAVEAHGAPVGIDWHGHDDRGLGLANALRAVECGADRVHATALGVGERAGNVAMELLVVNLALSGAPGRRDPSRLLDYCRTASRALDWPIPENHPVVGRNAFRTATGTHAAAIAKAAARGDGWLADRVYSSVPAAWVGREQEIGIGAMSGSANVEHWLAQHGVPPLPEVVRALVAEAKEADRVLTDDEIWRVVRRHVPLPEKKVAGETR